MAKGSPLLEIYLTKDTDSLPQVRRYFPKSSLRLSVTGPRAQNATTLDRASSIFNNGWTQLIPGSFHQAKAQRGAYIMVLPEARLIGAATADCAVKLYRIVRGVTTRKSSSYVRSSEAQDFTDGQPEYYNLSAHPSFIRSPLALIANLTYDKSPHRLARCTEVSEDMIVIIRGYHNGEVSIHNQHGYL